jgi:hypothetical protein
MTLSLEAIFGDDTAPTGISSGSPPPVIPSTAAATDGHEHFSLWVISPDRKWPEYRAGHHYDTSEPIGHRPMCSARGKPFDSNRLRTVRTSCDRCGGGTFTDTEIHGGKSIRRDCQCGRF